MNRVNLTKQDPYYLFINWTIHFNLNSYNIPNICKVKRNFAYLYFLLIKKIEITFQHTSNSKLKFQVEEKILSYFYWWKSIYSIKISTYVSYSNQHFSSYSVWHFLSYSVWHSFSGTSSQTISGTVWDFST